MLTQTVTHTPIADSGQGSTEGHLLAAKYNKPEEFLKTDL